MRLIPNTIRYILCTILIAGLCNFTTADAETVQWQISNGGNGHFYQPVYVPQGISWSQAKIEAELAGGHLATITSAQENEFVFSLIDEEKYWHNFNESNNHGPWIGGFQLDGAEEPAGGWTWVTGEEFLFSAWLVGEPSGQWGQDNENRLQYSALNNQRTPTWNDLIDELPLEYAVFGYIIEIPPRVIYVDDDATGANDGSSWENAYIYLQDALAEANTAEKPVEIHVAQGIYKPDMGVGITPGDREESFRFSNDVMVKGGYAGIDANDPNAHDIKLYETILSGDLNDDDYIDLANNDENSYHVATVNGTDNTTVIEGFTVTAGNANGLYGDGNGGGMYNYNSNPIITNCIFSGNSANYGGGGMYNNEGSPTLTNCTFTNNSADFFGGGMFNEYSDPNLTNCTFNNNFANASGGGMCNFYESSPNLTKCIFRDNIASYGGGMDNFNNSNPILIGCKFTYNIGLDYGGGMDNSISSPILANCKFSGNYATSGGGMYNFNSSPVLTNCIFNGNLVNKKGGGMWNYNESNPTLTNCTFSDNFVHSANGDSRRPVINAGGGICNDSVCVPVIINCILWGNTPDQIDGSANVLYNNIEGGWTEGEGNINVDPLFANPGYWADVYDPNVIVEPNDPNAVLIEGDYHLKSQAGRYDPNSESWVFDETDSPCIDAGDPNSPVGEEPDPNGGRINMGAYGGTAQASKTNVVVYIQWLGHSTVKVWAEDFIIYVDPQNLNESLHDAMLVCVTHTHGDHYSPTDIARVSNPDTQFMGPADVVQQYGSGQVILPAQTIDFNEVSITAVAAYNINKTNHPKSNNWVGYIIEFGGKHVYVAGDTDLTDEMKALEDIDVAFLPAGGTYTMNATEAAEATQYIKPSLAIPYHWGQVVGTINDAQTFVDLAYCPAMILDIGETISSEDWPVYSPLIAHWKFDETDGYVAFDSARDNDGVHLDEPLWQPEGGMVNGALEFDGIDDYVATPFVLNTAAGPFSVFAWVKGGEPGQVILSQIDCVNWLSANASDGSLMTELKGEGRSGSTLKSQTVITDDNWHRVGLTWDGTNRILYADDIVAAQDTQANLISAEGGLYIGVGNALDVDTFFDGLIDDVQIYNQVITP